MPNSYATVPNILPGNVTIGGDLTVQGNTIRIGAASPFTRVQKIPAGGASLSYNVDGITSTSDAASRNLYVRLVENASKAFSTRDHDGVGGANFGDLPVIWGWTGVTVNVTGTVAETTVFSVPIRGGFLGANGGFRAYWHLNGNVQGAAVTTFRAKLGATILLALTKAAIANLFLEYVVLNQNSQLSQRVSLWGVDSVLGVVSGIGNTAADTSVAQTFTFTIQPGAVGDNWDSRQATLQPVRASN